MKTFNELAQRIHEGNKQKGFWDKDRALTETVMLTVCELSEAIEADRDGKWATEESINTLKKYGDDNHFFKNHIKDTVQDEIADAFIRLMDLSAAYGIDIDFHISEKLKYNSTRESKHGKKY